MLYFRDSRMIRIILKDKDISETTTTSLMDLYYRAVNTWPSAIGTSSPSLLTITRTTEHLVRITQAANQRSPTDRHTCAISNGLHRDLGWNHTVRNRNTECVIEATNQRYSALFHHASFVCYDVFTWCVKNVSSMNII